MVAPTAAMNLRRVCGMNAVRSFEELRETACILHR